MADKALRPDDSRYYYANREKFIAEFNLTRKAVFEYISTRSSAERAEEICKDAGEMFEELLPGLPYVGGDISPGTKFILLAGQWLTVFKSMEKRNYGAPEVGHMMVEVWEDQLKRIPPEEVDKERTLTFDKTYMDLMKNWTHRTPLFKNDWIAEFVEGDGETFNYGIDYRACPVLEFFKTHGAQQFAPYYCLLDFPEAELMKRGFFRTKTLAQGDDFCNFRYKKGKEDLQDWKIEIKKI